MIDRTNHKALIIIAFAFMCVASNFVSLAQCNTRFSYSTTEEKGGTDKTEKRDLSISLKLEEGSEDNTIELFDLYEGEVIEKKDFSFKVGEAKKVFIGVKPSRYLIYIQNGSCKRKSITSGVEGIEIK